MQPLRYRYQTLEFGKIDLHVRTLRDNQQFSDPDGTAEALGISSATWPIFGVVWPSGYVLADLMQTYQVDGLRILEVGCGIGLASLVLNERQADITATDYHPSVGDFMALNVGLNNGKSIPFVRTGWDDAESELGRFDLIIGSDLLYESAHSKSLAAFIERHANPACQVIIIDPGRGNSGRFNTCMQTNGYQHSLLKLPESTIVRAPYKGRIMHYVRPSPASVQ